MSNANEKYYQQDVNGKLKNTYKSLDFLIVFLWLQMTGQRIPLLAAHPECTEKQSFVYILRSKMKIFLVKYIHIHIHQHAKALTFADLGENKVLALSSFL